MPLNLAIISPNENKYSETFIHMQIQSVKHRVILYSDGYLPKKISFDRGKSFQAIEKKRFWMVKNDLSKNLMKSFRKQKIDVVLAEYGPSGTEVMELCQDLNIPLIVHFHGFDAYRDDVLDYYGPLYKKMFHKSGKVIVVSKDMMAQLERLGCPEEKLQLLYYGVDTDYFKPLEDCEKDKYLLYNGRFVEKKNPLGVIRLFKNLVKKHPDLRLVMIGDGTLLSEAKGLVAHLNLNDKIEFTGVLDQVGVLEYLQNASIYLQLSIEARDKDSEGTPVSMLEAMACEGPVIANAHAGIRDVIRNGENGMIIKQSDVNEIERRVLELLKDKPKQFEIGRKARKTIIKEFDKRSYINALNNIIDEIYLLHKPKS